MERHLGLVSNDPRHAQSREAFGNAGWWFFLFALAIIARFMEGPGYFGLVASCFAFCTTLTYLGAVAIKAAAMDRLRTELEKRDLKDLRFQSSEEFTAHYEDRPVKGQLVPHWKGGKTIVISDE